MSAPKPSDQILAEYGLTEYLYDALKACEQPTYWKQGQLTHSIASLYKLRDRGLLKGPKTGQPYFLPFHLTEAGRDLLGRVERGLHKPEWLSEHQAKALGVLASRRSLLHNDRKIFSLTKGTLDSLIRAGYVSDGGLDYAITALGREAWQEWRDQKQKGVI